MTNKVIPAQPVNSNGVHNHGVYIYSVCKTVENRHKVKSRLKEASEHLLVEDAKNRDPPLVLKNVLLINIDEDISKVPGNQNGEKIYLVSSLRPQCNLVQFQYYLTNYTYSLIYQLHSDWTQIPWRIFL